MAFENLMNNPMPEPDLVKAIAEEVQKNYELHKRTYYFFKLSHINKNICQIIWIKTHNDHEEHVQFNFDSAVWRRSIMLKYSPTKKQYKLLCQGFFHSDSFQICQDKILNRRPFLYTKIIREIAPMPSRELIEKGFGEIAEIVRNQKIK